MERIHEEYDAALDEMQDLDEPSRYRVLLLNDDYSTFDWVVHILVTIFNKTPDEASLITQSVHQKGKGECGIYSLEIAETKIEQVHSQSEQAGYPLKCDMEKV